jgi:hypothetical protein
MVILDLLDGPPGFVLGNDPPSQTELTTATETTEAKDEVMEQSQKHRLGQDVRVLPAIAEAGDRLPELQDFAEIPGERRQFVVWRCVHTYKCKISAVPRKSEQSAVTG